MYIHYINGKAGVCQNSYDDHAEQPCKLRRLNGGDNRAAQLTRGSDDTGDIASGKVDLFQWGLKEIDARKPRAGKREAGEGALFEIRIRKRG